MIGNDEYEELKKAIPTDIKGSEHQHVSYKQQGIYPHVREETWPVHVCVR